MNEMRVAQSDLDELLKRLVREGNQIRSVSAADDDQCVVRFERRTEIREDA